MPIRSRSLIPKFDHSTPYHRYRGWVVAALILGFIFFWFAIPAENDSVSGLALIILLAEAALTLALDPRGVVSLRGRLFRTRLPHFVTALLGIVCFVLSLFWLIPYLIVAAIDVRKPDLDAESARLQRIATMEGELGILPSTEGECANCHKPLQAGAEFCAYCGAPVAPALRLCPNCHARTFPDAKWCPECGAALPPL